jgi:hypothetical protein
MERFIIQMNIERYQKLLGTSTDAHQRRMLFKLLSEELEKLGQDNWIHAGGGWAH